MGSQKVSYPFIKFALSLLLAFIVGGGSFVGVAVFNMSRDVGEIRQTIKGLDRYLTRDIQRLEGRVERLEREWGPM